MACRYIYQGKTYEAHEFDDILRAMKPETASQYMPSVRSIPEAPFVTATDKWLSLALKRVVKMAVDGGYDKVAFVNGEQSADRYDLSKQVESIRYEKEMVNEWSVAASAVNKAVRDGLPQAEINKLREIRTDLTDRRDEKDAHNGKYALTVLGKSGEKIFNEDSIAIDRIEELVGKDIAKKIAESKRTVGILKDTELKVGGEGMKAFYDKIVPNTTKEVIRKLGGGQMEVFGISVDLPYSVQDVGDGYGVVTLNGASFSQQLPLDKANSLAVERNRAEGFTKLQLGFTITEAMKEKASGGMPLFSRADNFKAWFGASRVKDMSGQAATVYHGTASDFSVFDKLKLGSQTEHHATSKLGFFFAQSPEKASSFATGDGANVMAVKLKIENPYQMTVTEAGQILTEDMARAKREDLQKQGYDGIRIANGGIWVAFEANQIKSATGNNGTYGKGDDIRFSRSGDAYDALRSAGTLKQATNLAKDMLHTDRTFNLWDRTVATQFQKASKSAPFKRVFEAYNNQSDDIAHYAIEAEKLAPSVLQRLDGVKDTLKAVFNSGAKYKADIDAIAKPLLANIEGVKGVKQVKYDTQSLKQIFKLTDRQIEMYKQVRLSVDTSLERLAQTYAAQMGADQGIPIDTMRDMGLQETVDLVKEYVQQSGTEQSAALMARLDKMVNETTFLQDNAYMPAMRFGNFAVTMKDGDTVAHFEMFESQIAANMAANKLKRQNPTLKVTQSLMNEDRFKMFKGVSPETVELFAQFTGMDSNEAYQDYIALAKSGRSSAKRLLEREGVAGFNEDITRILASFVSSNARQSAMNMNQNEITAAMSSKELTGDVQNEAQKLDAYMSDPQEEAHRLRGFLFLHFIGGSIASAAVNLTQPILQTAPYLSQFAGAKIMAAAAKMAVTGNITPNLKAAMQRAKDEGIVDPHEIHNLMADASGATLGGGLRTRALVKAWGSFFSVSEAYNRRLTFLAAYQTGLDMGQDKLTEAGFKDAYDFSKHAIIETQGLYSKTNRPNWARGAVGATLFTFKQFSISYVEFLSRLPNKQKALALGMLVLAAGLQGVPGAEDLEDLINTIGQSLGYNTNSKRALRQMAVDMLGEDLGLILTHGVSSMSNVDLQGRLGMGNLLPGTGLFKMSEKDKTRSATELAGVTGGLLNSAMDAIAKAQKGEIFGKTGALATMSPVTIRNFLQGAEALQTGVYTDTRGRKVQDVDSTSAFLKMLGFQPGDIAQESRKMSELMQSKGMMNAVSGAISDKWAESVAKGDRQGVMDAMASLKAWNENNPDSRIVLNPATIRQKIMAYKMTREQRFMRTLPKTMRGQAMDELN
jgi:hypothetical protein